MSYTERTHWGALAIAIVGAALYIPSTLEAASIDDLIGPLVLSTVLVVALVIAFAATVAVRMVRREGAPLADERDDAAERSATGWSYGLLLAGVSATAADLLIRNAQDLAPDPVVTFQLLLGSVFVAVCGGSIATLIRYRVGLR